MDRDGTLIEEGDYLKNPRAVKVLPGVPAALRRLKRGGYTLVVISNQSGIGRGLMTLEEARLVQKRFLKLFKAAGIRFNGYYFCPHAPGRRCACRKPKLGMVRRACRDLGRSWKRHVSVGDRKSDVQVGQRTGGLGILILSGYGRQWSSRLGKVKPNKILADFPQAADWILKHATASATQGGRGG